MTKSDNSDTLAPSTKPLLSLLTHKAKQVPFIYYPVHYLHAAIRSLRFPLRRFKQYIEWQTYKLFTRFDQEGLNKTESRTRYIIASLTSFPARLNIVPYVIHSLLRQTMKPDKLILWLAESQFPDRKLPKIFDKIKACGVDIEFREDIGPHKKYFFAVKEFPEAIIITFDDDIIYDNNIIETLYKSYIEHPECVSAMRVHKIKFLDDGSIAPYSQWEGEYKHSKGLESHQFLATTGAGTLYPPGVLHNEAFNISAIKKLCPKADDIWLKFMQVMKGSKVVPASDQCVIPGKVISESRSTALYNVNVLEGYNDVQIKNLLEAYNTWPERNLNLNGKTLLEIMNEDK